MRNPAISNDLVRETFRIPSCESGIELQLLRRHRSDAHTFNAQNTLMLMHGATFASASLFDVPFEEGSFMDVLARAGFDVWAVDARGYGGSTKPLALSEPATANPPQTPAIVAEKDLADAIDYVCQRQHIRGVSLIGMSWGGSVAGLYASRHSDRIHKLVLIAPLWLSEHPLRIDNGQELTAWRDVSLADAREAWLDEVPDEARAHLLPVNGFEQWLEVTQNSNSGMTPAHIVRAPTGPIADIRNHWRAGQPLYAPEKITGATLIVRAEWDRDVSIDMVQNLFGRLQSASYRRWVEIGAGTHRVLLERQRWQVHNVIIDFLMENGLGTYP